MRFGPKAVPGPSLQVPQSRSAPRLPAGGLKALRTPHKEPWRLPLTELTDLISVSFLDRAKVVTAEACGFERTGLTDFGLSR